VAREGQSWPTGFPGLPGGIVAEGGRTGQGLPGAVERKHRSTTMLKCFHSGLISVWDKGDGLSPPFSPPAKPRIPWIFAGGPGRPFFPYLGVPPDAGCDLRQGLDQR
jgi:hypothetical protein